MTAYSTHPQTTSRTPDWELRLDGLRVYDDINEAAQSVWVLGVGRKRRERVVIRGVETDLREQP